VLDNLAVLCKQVVTAVGHGEAAGRVILHVTVSAEVETSDADTTGKGQAMRTPQARGQGWRTSLGPHIPPPPGVR
jgi:hypothetical protein